MKESLIGKCGFFCGSCPTYLSGDCKGCMGAQQSGDCFTRDCVLEKKLNFCGECRDFPCETILTKQNVTVLSKSWLRWKKQQKDNR